MHIKQNQNIEKIYTQKHQTIYLMITEAKPYCALNENEGTLSLNR